MAAVKRRRSVAPSDQQETLAGLPWLYFLSGVPALVYQTVWQRILVLHSGVGTTSVSIIVAVYLLGLGLGSLGGAWLSRRLSADSALKWFGRLELTIGLCAVISPMVLYDLLYLRYGSLYGDVRVAFALHFAVLIIPTCLMGATLPLMTRALVSRADGAAASIGRLYGMNMLGAAFGAILSPWVLMAWTGAKGALWAGAACNFLVALMAFWINGNSQSQEISDKNQELSEQPKVLNTAESSEGRAGSSTFGLWTTLYLLGGTVAIGLEIVWFRILDVAVKSTAYTFGTVLGVYLGSMALGTLTGIRRAGRIKNPLTSFLYIQCLIALIASATVLLVTVLPSNIPALSWYVSYWASEDPMSPSMQLWWQTLHLYVLLPLIIMGIPTFLMGYSFCVLQRGIQTDVINSGYRVGVLQAANILGCTLGSLLVGLWLLNVLGSMHTLRLILLAATAFAVAGIIRTSSRTGFVVMAACMGGMAFLLPSSDTLWMRLHGQQPADGALFAEDVTGVSALTPQRNSSSWWMWANGKTQSLLPFGGFHSKLGIFPVTLHQSPKSVAIIGLGSGDTAWAAACRDETENVRIFEICTPEVKLLQHPFSLEKWPQVAQLLNDRRIRIDGRDARFVLMTEAEQYDVIEADAIRPAGSYAGYLYSLEFFQLCSKRLRPGGYMCSWSPTPLTHSTFRRAFPFVAEMEDGLLLIGSNDPIHLDLEGWKARLESIEKYTGAHMVGECIRSTQSAKLLPDPNPGDWVNTDLFPFDEFNWVN